MEADVGGEPLHILLLEDSPLDAELIHAKLVESELPFNLVREETRAGFLAALETCTFDLILSDYSLPSFDGLSALAIVRANWPHIPCIFVSGAIGEDQAVETLRAGATDYVLKHHLERLVPTMRGGAAGSGRTGRNTPLLQRRTPGSTVRLKQQPAATSNTACNYVPLPMLPC